MGTIGKDHRAADVGCMIKTKTKKPQTPRR